MSLLQNTGLGTALKQDVQKFLCFISVDEHNVLYIWNMKLGGVNISSMY